MEWIMNWWWATVLGPIVLGGAIAYALLNKRRLSGREKSAQTAQVRQSYRNDAEDSHL